MSRFKRSMWYVVIFTLSIVYAQLVSAQQRAVVKAKVAFPGIVSTIVGNGELGSGGDGGPAIEAQLNSVWDIQLDGSGNLFLADGNSQYIRKINLETGIITSVAGNGLRGNEGDGGPATEANLFNPRGLAVDASGNIYIGQQGDHIVRKVDAATGIITTVAGNGTQGFSGDGGPATEAMLNRPQGLAVDKSGNIYIADFSNYRVRKVDASTGVITTVAGTGEGGFIGDGGPAIEATVDRPIRVDVDDAGNLYIADQYNTRIRKVDPSGVITTLAQDGFIRHITLDKAGNIYAAYTNRVRKLDVGTGIISTVAGGRGGFSGDGGPAVLAGFNRIYAVAVDDAGNVYLSDRNNRRIRKVTPDQPASGHRLELARSFSGGAQNFEWSGTIGSDGSVDLDLQGRNVSGYYAARLVDSETGDVVSSWHSIPISSGQEIALGLQVGLRAVIQGATPLAANPLVALNANVPNPFNPATQISYELFEPGDVTLMIYNTLGQHVRTLVQKSEAVGVHHVTWDGKDGLGRSVSSGVYLYRLESGGTTQIRRMMLLK